MKKTELSNELLSDILEKRAYIQRALLTWEASHFRQFQWREERTPYSVLIAEVLLRRTTASAASRVYGKFIEIFPTVSKLSEARKKELEILLSSIGYQKRRATILLEMANHIRSTYNGEIPRSKEELLTIPHVGQYIANAILSFGYGDPAAIVDSNVERIFYRVFQSRFIKKPLIEVIQKISDTVLPRKKHQAFNYALLDLGSSVCKYGAPRCHLCPISNHCDYFTSIGKTPRHQK